MSVLAVSYTSSVTPTYPSDSESWVSYADILLSPLTLQFVVGDDLDQFLCLLIDGLVLCM